MADSVKDYMIANGYSKGDTIVNPDNENESYLVGKRGRCPSWLMALAGVKSKSKSKAAAKKAAKKVASVSSKEKASGAFVTLTNGTFYINGEPVYVSEDAEVHVPLGAVVSGGLPVAE